MRGQDAYLPELAQDQGCNLHSEPRQPRLRIGEGLLQLLLPPAARPKIWQWPAGHAEAAQRVLEAGRRKFLPREEHFDRQGAACSILKSITPCCEICHMPDDHSFIRSAASLLLVIACFALHVVLICKHKQAANGTISSPYFGSISCDCSITVQHMVLSIAV